MSRFHHEHRRSVQKRTRRAATLNLVSLMDIFTILVFFLMVNSSEVEVLQTSSDIKLPDSTSRDQPDNRLVVSVTEDDILVQGRGVARIADLEGDSTPTIAGLADELEHQSKRKGVMPEVGFEVTIMGDRSVPYWLLRKVMLTCQTSDFARLTLAVNRIEPVLEPTASAS
jgi:biopolymer transport protein ExbD